MLGTHPLIHACTVISAARIRFTGTDDAKTTSESDDVLLRMWRRSAMPDWTAFKGEPNPQIDIGMEFKIYKKSISIKKLNKRKINNNSFSLDFWLRLWSMFESREKHDRELMLPFCIQQYQWRHKGGWHVWRQIIKYVTTRPIFAQSSGAVWMKVEVDVLGSSL